MSARFASAPTREESHKQRRKEQDEAAVREQEYAGGQAVARESRERQRRPLCGVPDQPGTRKRLEDIEELLVRGPDEHLRDIIGEQEDAEERAEHPCAARRPHDRGEQ